MQLLDGTVEGACVRCGRRSFAGLACTNPLCEAEGYVCLPLDLEDGYGPPRMTDPEIGRRLDRYILARKLGEGGMGKVFLAYQVPIGMKVALKIVSDNLTQDPQAQARFRAEAATLAALNDPHIVRLIEFGIWASGTGEARPYLVMEYIEGGQTLEGVISARVAPLEAVELIEGVVYGAHALHHQNLIHRDLKPSNLMIQTLAASGRRMVRLIDFGIAKNVADSNRSVTGMGTAAYIPPEQLLSQNLGPWSDYYAIGVIAIELLFGANIFHAFEEVSDGEGLFQVLQVKRNFGLSDAQAFLERLSLEAEALPQITAFITQALAPDPAQRLQTPEAFLSAMRQAAQALSALGLSEFAPRARSAPQKWSSKPPRAQVFVPSAPPRAATPPSLPAPPLASSPRQEDHDLWMSSGLLEEIDFDEPTHTITQDRGAPSPMAPLRIDEGDAEDRLSARSALTSGAPLRERASFSGPPSGAPLRERASFSGPPSGAPLRERASFSGPPSGAPLRERASFSGPPAPLHSRASISQPPAPLHSRASISHPPAPLHDRASLATPGLASGPVLSTPLLSAAPAKPRGPSLGLQVLAIAVAAIFVGLVGVYWLTQPKPQRTTTARTLTPPAPSTPMISATTATAAAPLIVPERRSEPAAAQATAQSAPAQDPPQIAAPTEPAQVAPAQPPDGALAAAITPTEPEAEPASPPAAVEPEAAEPAAVVPAARATRATPKPARPQKKRRPTKKKLPAPSLEDHPNTVEAAQKPRRAAAQNPQERALRQALIEALNRCACLQAKNILEKQLRPKFPEAAAQEERRVRACVPVTPGYRCVNGQMEPAQ